MPFVGREVERSAPVPAVKVDVTASCKEQLGHDRVPVEASAVQCAGLTVVLVVQDVLEVLLVVARGPMREKDSERSSATTAALP